MVRVSLGARRGDPRRARWSIFAPGTIAGDRRRPTVRTGIPRTADQESPRAPARAGAPNRGRSRGLHGNLRPRLLGPDGDDHRILRFGDVPERSGGQVAADRRGVRCRPLYARRVSGGARSKYDPTAMPTNMAATATAETNVVLGRSSGMVRSNPRADCIPNGVRQCPCRCRPPRITGLMPACVASSPNPTASRVTRPEGAGGPLPADLDPQRPAGRR